MAQNRKIIVGSAVAVFIAVAFFVAWPRSHRIISDRPAGVAEEQSVSSSTFSLAINFGDGTARRFDSVLFSAGENLFQALQKKTADEKITFEFKEYPGLGMLVSRIGENKNGEQGKYWQYWVNGKYAEKGPDAYVIKLGDAVEWKFEGSKQ